MILRQYHISLPGYVHQGDARSYNEPCLWIHVCYPTLQLCSLVYCSMHAYLLEVPICTYKAQQISRGVFAFCCTRTNYGLHYTISYSSVYHTIIKSAFFIKCFLTNYSIFGDFAYHSNIGIGKLIRGKPHI